MTRFFILFMLFSANIAANELDYYKNEFKTSIEHPLKDTLFEKTIWRRKVSHIVFEHRDSLYRVTLLMILEYPYNYKSQNYAIYYSFKDFKKAYDKYIWLNQFLDSSGVARVKINGNEIIDESILFPGYPVTRQQVFDERYNQKEQK